MKPKRIDETRMLTGMVRLSYPNLLTPSESPYSKGKYMTSFILDEKDTETLEMVRSLINDAIKTAKAGEWKGKKGIVDGERIKELDAEYQVGGDKYSVRCSGGNQPITVIDPMKNKVTDNSLIYGGAYARLMLRAFTWTQAGRMGVSLQCQAVQLLGGGEDYGSGAPDLDLFDVEDNLPFGNNNGGPAAEHKGDDYSDLQF